jgi:hypothetical protein
MPIASHHPHFHLNGNHHLFILWSAFVMCTLYKVLRLVLWSMALKLSGQILLALNLDMIFFLVNVWFKALSTHPTCRNPNLGLATKAKGVTRLRAKRKPGSHITYSWECKKVWGSEPSHSQGNSHFGRWSPGGLPKFQREISGVKTQWLETFFISLESSWNVDV